MAFASDSTTAPARPLLPLPALDRSAIGRDGWARARELAARLGGAVRDHVAEGMRQAWAAARGLLQAAASAPAASEASALASESVAAASASHSPAQSRSVDRIGYSDAVADYPNHIGEALPLLPLPAPLPPLSAALARRRAVFGAVALPLALAAGPASADAPPSSGREVIVPEARTIEALSRDALDELHKAPLAGEDQPDTYAARAAVAKAGELIELLARTPAANRADLVRKAMVCAVADRRDVDNVGALCAAVAVDVVHVDGGAQ